MIDAGVLADAPPELATALETLRAHFGNDIAKLRQAATETITDFSRRTFYIPSTRKPLMPYRHQSTILHFMFHSPHKFQTMGWSAPKKSGKTAISGVVGRYVAEKYGAFNEVYAMANDEEQARGRIYQAIQQSIELDPHFIKSKRIIPNYWKIIERHMECVETGSKVTAVSNDYRGEAGSNPTATLWTELWGFTSSDSKKFWDELTPVPTRPHSFRFVDTYAGFIGESQLLEEFYETHVTHAERLTHADLEPYGGWPFPDQPPVYVNEAAASCVYWDEGEVARRMPWQTPEYYVAQAATLRPEQYERLHLNHWVGAQQSFIPAQWWSRLARPYLPMSATPGLPVVLALDASVTGDCTALVAVTRDPESPIDKVLIRDCRVWHPSKANPMNYDRDVRPVVEQWCRDWNVVQLAYDPHQMHLFAQQLMRDEIVWAFAFEQGKSRLLADKQFYDLICQDRIHWCLDGTQEGTELSEHVLNCAAQIPKGEDNKLRLVKKATNVHIDAAVATSMAQHQALYLVLA